MNSSQGRALLYAFLFTAGAMFDFAVVREGGGLLPDDSIYRFQAQCLALGRARAPIPPEPDAFRIPGLIEWNGTRFGKYYPGYPALLAIPEKTGAPWLLNPVLGGLIVYSTFLLGRSLGSSAAGEGAAILLACSPWLAGVSTSYSSHAASGASSLFGGLALLRSRREGSRKWGGIAGALFGFCCLARPFTGALLLLPITFLGIRDCLRADSIRRNWILPFSFSVLVAGISVLAWNRTLTGDFLTSSYALSKSKDSIGLSFTPKGSIDHSKEARGTSFELYRYTPQLAFKAMLDQFVSAGEKFLPIPLSGLAIVILAAPFLVPILSALRRNETILLAAFPIVLVAGHFFYSGSFGPASTPIGPRYYTESLPAYAVLLWLGLVALVPVRLFPWARAAFACAAVMAIVGTTLARTSAGEKMNSGRPRVSIQSLRLAHELRGQGPNEKLVFVDISTYERKSALLVNRADLRGRDVVAVYREPAKNRAVIDAFPGRDVFLYRGGPGNSASHFQFYSPESDSTGPPNAFPYNYERKRGRALDPGALEERE